MVVFQALTWEARDGEDEHLISIFGKTEDGKSVCVTTAFTPYFFIKLPIGTDSQKVQRIYDILGNQCKDSPSYSLTKQKDVWGFQNNEEFAYMKINFKDLQARRLVDSFLRRPLNMTPDLFELFGVRTVKVYESNLDPVLRLMHRTGIPIRVVTFCVSPSGELLYTILYSIINKIYPIEYGHYFHNVFLHQR